MKLGYSWNAILKKYSCKINEWWKCFFFCGGKYINNGPQTQNYIYMGFKISSPGFDKSAEKNIRNQKHCHAETSKTLPCGDIKNIAMWRH